MAIHVVRQGESVISLSKRYGIPADKILNHPDNRSLRNRQRDSGILFPGDRLTIPEREIKEIDCATEQRHRFRCNNRNSLLKIRFLAQDEPRANEPYLLRIHTQEYRGNLDNDGWLRVSIPADTQEAVIELGEESEREEFAIRIGHLDPVDEIRGVQQRLNNMGFFYGAENDQLTEEMQGALCAFQAKHGLEESGELDDATKSKLVEIYGC